MSSFTDGYVTSDEQEKSITPVWVGNAHKSDKKLLEWFNDTYPHLENLNKDRIEGIFNNLLWFTGQYDSSLEYRKSSGGNREKQKVSRKVPLVVNHIFDLTEQRIARLSRFKSNVKALPVNDEFEDKKSAQFADLILKQLNRQNRFDLKLQEIERWNGVFGEMYLNIDWNPKIGDLDEKGRPLGDVKYTLAPPFFKMFDPKRSYDATRWCLEVHEVLHFEEVKKKYGKEVKPKKGTSIFNYDFCADGFHNKGPEDVVVYRFVYPPDEFIPEGVFVLLTEDKILKRYDKYPYSHNKFPFVRLTDIDVPNVLHGVSLFEQLKPIQHNYNKMTALIVRNILLTSHPKIMMPEGAAKIESMGNTATAVTFNGPIAPSIVTFPANPPEVYGFRGTLKEEMEQIGGVFGVSRGAPPPGIRAGIALQFLEEQELQRANTSIEKHNHFVVQVNEMAIGVAGDYYATGTDASKKRLVRILGPNSQYQTKTLEDVNLSGPYTIQIQNSTALAESRAGRTQRVIDLAQNIPGLLSREQISDLLELGAPEKFYTIATAALRAAESENEDLLRGEPVSLPSESEQHLNHWRTHIIQMQGRFYKEDVPEEIKAQMEEHVAQHENFMLEHALENPEAHLELRSLAGFPLFHPPTPRQKAWLVTGQVPPEQQLGTAGAGLSEVGQLPQEGELIDIPEQQQGELPPTEPVPQGEDIEGV